MSSLIDDFELDHVVMYVRDLSASSAEWRERYGLTEVAEAGSTEQGFRSVELRQGEIRLVLTEGTDERHPASMYVGAHGDGVADIAFRTADVEAAFAQIVERGIPSVAEPRKHESGGVALSATVVGFGDVVHTLVQRRPGDELPEGFRPIDGAGEPPADGSNALGLLNMDHFAVCLPIGELAPTIAAYRRAFGFEEAFEEHIVVGKQAMLSKVVRSRTRSITFTMLQPDPAADAGQIDEFLKNHDGAGVQHIAFAVDDVVRAVGTLVGRGVEFLPTPAAYYRLLRDRVSLRKHPVESLRDLSILVDQDHGGQLFQIFARSTHPRRTIFFEIIERLGAETFGSSNIKALYEAVEAERAVETGKRS